jgi:hypothetical protein
VQVRFVVAQGFGDWGAFWAAGATAGTPALLAAHKHAAWMVHHHLPATIFPYLPGAAWLFFPIRHAPLAAGYAINFLLMAACIALAAIISARVYRLSRTFALISAFAWAPAIAALATGQISPLGLLLVVLAIAGIAVDSPVLCGVAVGLMLYKLPYALPFVALLAVRRNVRALLVVAAFAVFWYVASVAATAGDWQWPAHYAAALQGYAAADARYNAEKAVGLPLLLLRAGVPQFTAILCGAAFFALALPMLARMPALEAASLTPLLGLALGPHTLPYDLALVLPALYYVMTHVREPLRTRAACAMYLVAPLWLLSGVVHFDVLAPICEGLALLWILKALSESTARSHLTIADPRNRSEA